MNMTADVITHNVVAPRPYLYTIKLETTAKGFIQPSVTVNSDSQDLWKTACCLLDMTIDELKTMSLKIATEIKEENQKEKEKRND